MSSELESGISTELIDGRIRVEWIAWDSDFRNSGLDVGDYIVGVNGRPFDMKKHYKAVGQYAESQLWDEVGASEATPVTLNIERAGRALEAKGKLHKHYFYYDADKKQAIAPGGPRALANDGFDGPWSFWLEKTLKKYSYALVRMWTQKSLNTRTELAAHLETRPRIDYLLKHHPGPFANAMLADWTRVAECLRGKRIELTDADLEYRSLGEKRRHLAKEAANKAWEALCGEVTAKALPVPPLRERQKIVGQIVELPRVTFRNIVNDLGRAYMAIGSAAEGYYFLVLETPVVFTMYAVLQRFKGQINPTLAEQYRFIARVNDAPRMITVNRRTETGLSVEVLAVLAGDDECCVDLRRQTPMFAGEETLSSFSPIALADTAPPEAVIAAMIQAIKLGDQKTWRGLFADWRVVSGAGGRETIDAAYVPGRQIFNDAWERSRKNILGEVLDARIERVDPVKTVLAREAEHGLPQVEQVRVWVDHFGRFDDGVYAFKNLMVNREWVLQRIDAGPWRIVSVQSL